MERVSPLHTFKKIFFARRSKIHSSKLQENSKRVVVFTRFKNFENFPIFAHIQCFIGGPMKISHRQKMKFDQRFFFGEKRWFSTGASNSKNHLFSKNCLNQRVFERIPWLKNLKGGEPRISSRISKNGHPMNTRRCKK